MKPAKSFVFSRGEKISVTPSCGRRSLSLTHRPFPICEAPITPRMLAGAARLPGASVRVRVGGDFGVRLGAGAALGLFGFGFLLRFGIGGAPSFHCIKSRAD